MLNKTNLECFNNLEAFRQFRDFLVSTQTVRPDASVREGLLVHSRQKRHRLDGQRQPGHVRQKAQNWQVGSVQQVLARGMVSMVFHDMKKFRVFNVLSKTFLSNSLYVQIKLGNQDVRTRTIKKELNPTWDETFCLLVSTPALQKVSLQCWDDDDDVPLGSDPDDLGVVEIDVASIHPGRVVNKGWDFPERGSLFVDFYRLGVKNENL